MKRAILGILLLLVAATAFAQFAPPARPFVQSPLTLGDNFDTLFISCGTPINPICPRTLDPLAGPVLLHYVAAGGRSPDVCSASLFVQHPTPAGTRSILLLRLVFGPDTADNVTLTLPQPIRLEADDVLAVSRAQGTCGIHATLGIEYVE